ncbi:hypothetical protein GDO78_003935 [Eleutherodactylus coqui]|uniref:Uncharacterized protein n=1 Tax=Eleutherodactylus coqui TaxID=57060 RepID=A0A8J6EW28_ELECQ|nr:hypothetical protein GDO78_003935 [Eleutherodactylus coqui]
MKSVVGFFRIIIILYFGFPFHVWRVLCNYCIVNYGILMAYVIFFGGGGVRVRVCFMHQYFISINFKSSLLHISGCIHVS